MKCAPQLRRILHDCVTLLAAVHRDINDEVPPSEFRLVVPEVIAFGRQALQRP